MKAVIMAGGKGTRLGALARDIPKPMMAVGGRPVLERQVTLLKRYGIQDIIMVVGYLGEQIEAFFGDGSKWSVSITYFREKVELGIAGRLKEMEHLLTGDFLLLYGDVMMDMNLKRFIAFHLEHQSECTLAIHPNDHPADSDLVEMDAQCKITTFHPKPHDPRKYYRNLVNAGAYIMSPTIVSLLEKGKEADLGRDVFPRIYSRARFYGYNTAEYLKDMGTPKRLLEVQKDYVSGKIERMNNEHPRKAIFLDRDGVLNIDKGLIYRVEDLGLLSGTAEAVRKINESEYLAIVVTNQPVIARGLCTMEELDIIHKKLETELGEGHAKLDALYFCPHHPEKDHPVVNAAYAIECDCRKPKPGMLLQAAKDFTIDLTRSYLIGDSWRDIEAAHAAGVISIHVGTGADLKNEKTKPRHFFKNVGESVNFILHNPAEHSI